MLIFGLLAPGRTASKSGPGSVSVRGREGGSLGFQQQDSHLEPTGLWGDKNPRTALEAL